MTIRMRIAPIVAAVVAMLALAGLAPRAGAQLPPQPQPQIPQPTLQLAPSDLSILSVEPVGALRRGFCNTFNVTVKNGGGGPATPFLVRLNTCAPGRIMIESGVVPFQASCPGLLAGKTTTVTVAAVGLTSNPNDTPCQTLTAVVDPDNAITESNENNNSFTRSLTVPTEFCGSPSMSPTSFSEPLLIGTVTSTSTAGRTINLKLAPAMNEPVTLSYEIFAASNFGSPATAGTACADGIDFVKKSGTVTFNPGETSKDVTFSVCGDRVNEDDENFFFSMNVVSGPASLGSSVLPPTLLKLKNAGLKTIVP